MIADFKRSIIGYKFGENFDINVMHPNNYLVKHSRD